MARRAALGPSVELPGISCWEGVRDSADSVLTRAGLRYKAASATLLLFTPPFQRTRCGTGRLFLGRRCKCQVKGLQIAEARCPGLGGRPLLEKNRVCGRQGYEGCGRPAEALRARRGCVVRRTRSAVRVPSLIRASGPLPLDSEASLEGLNQARP